MEEVRVHEVLGLQVIVIPEGYRLAVERVYMVRDGIALVIIPVNAEGEDMIHQRRLDALSGPDDDDDTEEE